MSAVHRQLCRPPAGFSCDTVVVAPGSFWPVDGRTWRGALIVVRHGRVELVTAHGLSRTFVTGSLMWFDGGGLTGVENLGPVPAVLVAVRRAKDRLRGDVARPRHPPNDNLRTHPN